MPISAFLKKYPKKHIIFDLDETLSTLHINWSGFRDAFWKHVGEFDRDIAMEQVNSKGRAIHLYNAVIQKHGKSGKKLVDTFCEAWERDNYDGYSVNGELQITIFCK